MCHGQFDGSFVCHLESSWAPVVGFEERWLSAVCCAEKAVGNFLLSNYFGWDFELQFLCCTSSPLLLWGVKSQEQVEGKEQEASPENDTGLGSLCNEKFRRRLMRRFHFGARGENRWHGFGRRRDCDGSLEKEAHRWGFGHGDGDRVGRSEDQRIVWNYDRIVAGSERGEQGSIVVQCDCACGFACDKGIPSLERPCWNEADPELVRTLGRSPEWCSASANLVKCPEW